MTIEEFEERARAAFESIPPRFRVRVDGPHVLSERKEHEHVPGSHVLGECVHHPDWTGESPLFSSVLLYHGSFIAIARRDPTFDVAAEIVETVLHEVQHHVEDAAGIDRLRDLDWAEDQNDRRLDDLPHGAHFWRAGHDLGAGLHRVGSDLFLEVALRPAAWAAARRSGLVLDVLGERLELPASDIPEPADEAALLYEWDWSEIGDRPHDVVGDELGDLVVILRLRRLPIWPGVKGSPRVIG